jgi:hypothetical protein
MFTMATALCPVFTSLPQPGCKQFSVMTQILECMQSYMEINIPIDYKQSILQLLEIAGVRFSFSNSEGKVWFCHHHSHVTE